MKSFLIITLLIVNFFCFSQEKDRHVWFFGVEVGVDFLDDTIKKRTDSFIDAKEGCATICDDEGKLLFAASSSGIYDSTGNIMFDSYWLNSDYSSTNAAVALKKPGSDNLYYVFTSEITDDFYGPGGVWYTIVDMNLENGLGDVASLNIPIKDSTTEKICLIPHDNGTDYWVVIRPFNVSEYYAYKISSEGVAEYPIKSNIGKMIPLGNHKGAGYLKASLDGKLVAAANSLEKIVEIYDFDNSTGEFSNLRTLTFSDSTLPYGIEFSPNNKYLYVSTSFNNKLIQYDLSLSNESAIDSTKYLIATPSFNAGALQIGPDSSIYFTLADYFYLACIEQPEKYGDSCAYDSTKLFLSYWPDTRFGLPLWIPQNKPDSLPNHDTNIILPTGFKMPTGFTPNDDGYNDLFVPIKIEGYKTMSITIFNRWGDQVYYNHDIYNGWDGTYNGKRTVDGTYFWVAEGKDFSGKFHQFKGYVDLRR